jgi:hypothetical protein
MTKASNSPPAHLPGKSTTPRKPDGKFAKGAPKPANAGRAKGKRNRNTILLKTAILEAAELCGSDGKGREGLVGYLRTLAMRERPVFAKLLEKVLPMQLNLSDDTKRVYTPEEAMQRLTDRGLPVPPSLLELTATVAGALNDQHQDGVSDEFDNRRFFDDETGDSV